MKRSNVVDNYFNQMVKHIKNYCIENRVGNVVIGYNKTWKNEINIGKINNRNFASIPMYTLIRKLQSKC